jgi:hypothetical protein
MACSTNAKEESVKPKVQKKDVKPIENYSIFFNGESEHWKVNLIERISGDKEDEHVIITYKGNDFEKVGIVKNTYILPDKTIKKEVKLYPTGSYTIIAKGKNKVIPPVDYIVKGTIEWDGHKETVDLKIH